LKEEISNLFVYYFLQNLVICSHLFKYSDVDLFG